MSVQSEARAAKQPPPSTVMTGAEKVAVLLLALGKARAAKLLKRFDAEDLKLLSRSVSDLRPVSSGDLESLVEEFGQRFASGVNFIGTAEEVKSLLSGVLPEEEATSVAAEPAGPITGRSLWDGVSRAKIEVLRAYLVKEHPQTVALILSRIDSDAAAKAISSFPADYRAGLMCRMLAIKKVSDEALAVVEMALSEDLLATAAPTSHFGIADILNRLDKTQSQAVLKALADMRPDDAKALKNLLFTFDDLATLSQSTRSTVLDQVPIERLVLALKGTEAPFQAAILSVLSSRSKRMVEAELQGGTMPPAREIADARRAIVDTVLKLAAKGSIELRPPDEDIDAITA
jgi:flagellar motor switch protein FliG